MRLLTPDQALELDRQTFLRPGFSSEVFIRMAGHAVVKVLGQLSLLDKRILVVAGPSHNGDDGRVVFQELESLQVSVSIWSGVGLPDFENFDVIVDALLGVGLSRPLTRLYLDLVKKLNEVRSKREKQKIFFCVISVDTPTGLNNLTGWPDPVAVCAHHTVTMQAAKPGFFQNEGPCFTGRIWRIRLPYPDELFKEMASTHFAFGAKLARRLLPSRPFNSNKGTFGSLNIVAGSAKYPGASILAARAALRTGVGSVRLIQFENVFPNWFSIPETLLEIWSLVPKQIDSQKVWVVGPGLEDHSKTKQIIEKLLASYCEKVILDATALEVLAKMKVRLPPTWLLTPHPKELGRLIKKETEEVQKNRFESARMAQEKYGASVLLKGYKTVLASAGKIYICLRGHSALAKAGSGDVLSGIIGSLGAQGLTMLEAGMLAAVLQGMAADMWIENGDPASMLPSDLIELLPRVQKTLRQNLK